MLITVYLFDLLISAIWSANELNYNTFQGNINTCTLKKCAYVTPSNCMQQHLSKNKLFIFYERFLMWVPATGPFNQPQMQIPIYTHIKEWRWANVLIKALRVRLIIVQYMELERNLSDVTFLILVIHICSWWHASIILMMKKGLSISESIAIDGSSTVYKGKKNLYWQKTILSGHM